MISEEIILDFVKQRNKHFFSGETKEPKFNIYIGNELFYKMMTEINIRGQVDSLIYELFTQQTILGNKIYRVSDHPGWKVFKI